eukprot:Rhum_TRINITY_DN13917_c0_g1::Rhum_TRINITY_DN13917_c0_g1_i2::g.65975::m.65975
MVPCSNIRKTCCAIALQLRSSRRLVAESHVLLRRVLAPPVTGVLVQVLVHADLVARRAALAGGDRRPRQEDLPQPEQTRRVLVLHRGTVAHPVVVPRVQRVAVVAADRLHGVHLEPGELALLDVPVQRRRRVGTREDVLGHEQAPRDVLPVRALAQTSDLHQEQTVVLHQSLHTVQVQLEVLQTHVLRHLDRRHLVEAPLLRDVTVVHREDLNVLLQPLLLVLLRAPRRTLHGERHTRRLRAVLLSRVPRERTPAAADVEERLTLLQVHLVADHRHLVLLRNLQGLVQSAEETRRVHHRRSKEGTEEVVSTVVVVGDLLLRRGLVLERRRRLREELLDQEAQLAHRGLEVQELVPVLVQHLEHVGAALELDVALNEVLVELADRHLAVGVHLLQRRVLEHDVLLSLRRLRRVVHEVPQTVRDGDGGHHHRQVQRQQEVHLPHDEQDQVRHHQDQQDRGVRPPRGHRPSDAHFLHLRRLRYVGPMKYRYCSFY